MTAPISETRCEINAAHTWLKLAMKRQNDAEAIKAIGSAMSAIERASEQLRRQGERADPFIHGRMIRVTWHDGDTTTTAINGTRDEIERYYLRNQFNLGDAERDMMKCAVKVEFLD